MGILDDILGEIAGGSGSARSPNNQLGDILGALVTNVAGGPGVGDGGPAAGDEAGGGGGDGALGGIDAGSIGGALVSGVLGALVRQLMEKGLNGQVKSWVGSGRNVSITGDEARSALGEDAIGRVARTMGLSNDEAAGKLSELLPAAIDAMTPNGDLPANEVAAAGDDAWWDREDLAG